MRSFFLMNILLTLVWVALTGKFEVSNFLFGFALNFGVLYVISRGNSDLKYFQRVPKTIGFLIFFIKELIKANLQVAYDVVTPRDYMKPGIIGVPLDAKSDLEITLLANFITMTPGTLSLDVSTDKKTLYIHAMYVEDKEAFIRGIKDGFERRLLEIMR
ncbi:MAG: Na+/H+ antiporter subunit E [Cryomorphaceae bacterium]|nr:Na+/H+ antiporter subunit E [Cryomorphaceae bacterium]